MAASDSGEADEISGELQVGKTDSVILYFGEESGDYAAYCFPNDSEAGRAILAACKDKEQCEIKGKVDYEAGCNVPGLEADLSAKGKILKVNSVKIVRSEKVIGQLKNKGRIYENQMFNFDCAHFRSRLDQFRSIKNKNGDDGRRGCQRLIRGAKDR